MNSYIGYNEFVLVKKMSKEYDDMKEEIKSINFISLIKDSV